MVHFSSAGNSGPQPLGYPASIPAVMAVAAIAPSGALASFSNHGPTIEFCAPGQQVLTTDRTGPDGYGPGDSVLVAGTSFSSPYAAAVAALILSREPGLPAAEVERRMRVGCRDLGAPGFDAVYSWGLVNAWGTLLVDAPPPGATQVANGVRLERAHPSPFVSHTELAFTLATPAATRLRIHDAAGRRVRTLVDGALGAGRHARRWDGRSDSGAPLPAGLYFARLESAGAVAGARIVRLARPR